jgi:uncharacterized membrane protein
MTTQGNVAAATATLKPGVISAYGHGWNKLWPQFGILLLIWIILAAISAGGGYIPYVGFLVGLFLSGPLNYGVNYAYLKATRGEKAEVQDMFTVFNQYWNVFLANLLVMIIVIVGFILLIVPGIYLSCKLAIVSYLVVDKKMQVTDALKASWNMTNGHGWKVFLIGLLAIPIFIAGAICLGVGIIISMMWFSMAMASLYHAVSLEKGVPVTPARAALPPQAAS